MAERGTNKMNITKFDSNVEMTDFLAKDIIEKLAAAINETQQATLLVSGGRSPIALFKILSESELDWSRVIISLVDDRWVDVAHQDSNEALIKEHLLVGNASKATFIGLVGDEDSAFDGIDKVVARIGDIKRIDVMILGMGEDGHTASIFPCSAQVDSAMSPDNHARLFASQPTTAPHQRISFTLNEILAAKQVYLPLTGEKKLKVFEQAQQIKDQSAMPISAVINKHVALDVLVSQ